MTQPKTTTAGENGTTYRIGDTLTVTCESPAHGGAFVARTGSGVIFVRHGIPGETATVRITGTGPKNRFYFADVIAVDEPSPYRRQHPWIQADSLKTPEQREAASGVADLLGGMEYGHIDPTAQRRYKTHILRTQLERLGKINAESSLLTNLEVEPMPNRDSVEGDLSWRSRVRYDVVKVGESWRIAMHPHQSNHSVPVVDFPLAARDIRDLHLEKLNLYGVKTLEATVSSRGRILLQFEVLARFACADIAAKIEPQCEALFGPDLAKKKISLFFTPQRASNAKPTTRSYRPSLRSAYRRVREGDVLSGGGLRSVTEEVLLGKTRIPYQVSAGGFWQVHRCAPSVLAQAVLGMAGVDEGACVLDLYAGAGLFTAAMADAVGEKGTVISIEGSPVTHRDARANFAPGDGISRTERAAQTRIEVIRGDVAHHLVDLKTAYDFGEIPPIDVAVVDPSRDGANRTVLERLASVDPTRIVYVACDPASLGRDTAILRELGYGLTRVRGFDMYPNTHHVEAVALFEKPHIQYRVKKVSTAKSKAKKRTLDKPDTSKPIKPNRRRPVVTD